MDKLVVSLEDNCGKWLARKLDATEFHKDRTLIVRQGQVATVYINGQLDKIYEPGEYVLKGISKSQQLSRQLGSSKNKKIYDIYFLNTTEFMDAGWGTKDPVIRRDKEFGIVRLTAFGTFSFKLIDYQQYIENTVGARINNSGTYESVNHITSLISQYIAMALNDVGYSVVDMAGHYNEIAELIKCDVNRRLTNNGVIITGLIVENIGTTGAISKAIDEYSEMNLVKNDMESYERFQKAKAMREASVTPGNAVAMELGEAFGKKMAKIVDTD